MIVLAKNFDREFEFTGRWFITPRDTSIVETHFNRYDGFPVPPRKRKIKIEKGTLQLEVKIKVEVHLEEYSTGLLWWKKIIPAKTIDRSYTTWLCDFDFIELNECGKT